MSAARAVLLALPFVMLSVVASVAQAGNVVARLQALDKVTARISEIEAPLDVLVRFDRLGIIVRSCHKTPPEEPPESTAFIEIWEIKPGEQAIQIYGGWMFASSPGLSALEHPVYDVWVLECIPRAPSASSDE
jgi:hypothetical protein